MKYANPRSLARFSKVFLAATSIAIFSPILCAYAVPGVSTTLAQQLLVNESTDSESSNLPESVRLAVLQNISQRTGLNISTLRIIHAQGQTWSDGCLGLEAAATCSQAMVKGWQVIAAQDNQIWVYRTDASGKVAKFDDGATQFVTRMIASQETTSQQTTSRTTKLQRRTTQASTASTSVTGKKTGFSLAILQPAGNFSDVVARVSFKGKRQKGYLKERF